LFDRSSEILPVRLVTIVVHNNNFGASRATGLFLGLLLFSGISEAQEFRPLPEAPQRIYLEGVPHVGQDGRIRRDFDPAQSRFLIGIAHALQGEFLGRRYDLGLMAQAGFNTIAPFQLQDPEVVVPRAADLGLKVVWPYATPALADRFRGDRRILAFEVDHEPSMQWPDESAGNRLGAFLATKRAIQAIDPARLVLTVNSPSISPPRTEVWRAWSRAADVHAHWKYPFMYPPVETFAGERGIGETLALAQAENGEGKPIWWYAQGFASPIFEWFLPTPGQARGMLYAGLVQGVSAVFWFAYDSPVTRGGRVVGIAPDTPADHGIAALPYDPAPRYPPLVASAAQVEASRTLWRAVRVLNHELAVLGPILLHPTADIPYRVAVSGEAKSPTPIRALLKPDGDDLVLIAVNIDNAPLTARFEFEGRGFALARLFEDPAGPDATAGQWTDAFPAFGVRVYRLTPLRP